MPSGNPYANMYNLLQGMRDLLGAEEAQRQQEEARRQQEEALRRQQIEEAYRRELEIWQRFRDGERERAEVERRRHEQRQAEERRLGANDDATRRDLTNPFNSPENPSAPVGGGYRITGSGPLGNQGVIRPATPGAATRQAGPPPETDQEIQAFCQSAPNPRACVSAQTDARNRGVGPYSESQRRYWAERARQEREGQPGGATPPAVVASVPNVNVPERNVRPPNVGMPTAPNVFIPQSPSSRTPGATVPQIHLPAVPSVTPPRVQVPGAAQATLPQRTPVEAEAHAYLDRCRDIARRSGASEPETVVGCYDEARARHGLPARTRSQRLRDYVQARRALAERAGQGQPTVTVGGSDGLDSVEEDPGGNTVVAQARDPNAPPPNHTRMEYVTQGLCERWKGRFQSDSRGVPVCDFPDIRFTIEGSETDEAVRAIGAYDKPE